MIPCTKCSSVEFENLFHENADLYHSFISQENLSKSKALMHTQILRKLNSRFALEPRYGRKDANAMAEQIAKTNNTIVRSNTLWKAVASGDGHYLRSIMGHSLPMEWFDRPPPRATLLYRASRDGWRVQNFHSKCDGKGATLTAIKTANGCVFGGFSDVTWDSQGRNTTSSKAWLFSIKSLAGTPPQKMPIKPSART